jgi:ribonuclease G
MGLIQMTRKRIRKPITRMLCEPCFYCEGEGYLLSRKSICLSIGREILRQSRDMIGHGIMLRVNPEIAEFLHDEEKDIIAALERRLERQIVIYPNSRFHLEEFELFETTQNP